MGKAKVTLTLEPSEFNTLLTGLEIIRSMADFAVRKEPFTLSPTEARTMFRHLGVGNPWLARKAAGILLFDLKEGGESKS